MTSKKSINITEFVNWGNEIWELSRTIFKDIKESEEEKEKIAKVISAFCTRIISGNTFALEFFLNNMFMVQFNKLPEEIKETEFNFPCEDGAKKKMTGEQWSEYLHQRVEEHHRVRVGKDIEEKDFIPLLERLKKTKDWINDKENKEELLSQIYQTKLEDYDLIWGIAELNDKFYEITGHKIIGNYEGISKSDIEHCPYLLEDVSQIVFKAQEAIEKEKEKPEIPEKKKEKEKEKKEEKKHQLSTLEEEMKELERQKKDLEEKLSKRSLDPAKKASLEKDLKENKKQREAVQARLESLQRELKNNDNNKNDKMNLAIGLGIFAAVVAVICLIIVLARRPRHREY